MLWGNVLAFFLAGIQAIFRVIHLDPVTYYMDTVPINFSLGYVILLNVGSDRDNRFNVDCPDDADFQRLVR